MKMKPLALILATLLTSSAAAIAEPSTSEVQRCFQLYQKLSTENDPKLANLYSSAAVIRNTRYFPNGQTKQLVMSGEQFKGLIASSAKLAEAQGDRDVFSKITYRKLGNDVEVKALRHSVRKNYDSWFIQNWGHTGSTWQIMREESQSRP